MRIFRTMSILPDWAVVANALRSFWERHTSRSGSEGRFRSAAAMFWLILSITTIGLRPPPDDVGRQTGCKVRFARNTGITISRQASGPLLQYGDDHQWLITNTACGAFVGASAIKLAGPKLTRKIDRLSSSCRLPPHRVASKNRSPLQLRLQVVQRQTPPKTAFHLSTALCRNAWLASVSRRTPITLPSFVQFISTVSGEAPTEGRELIRKRLPSGETAYWKRTILGAMIRVWKSM